MWFDEIKKESLELEGLSLEEYEAIKRTLQQTHKQIKLLHDISLRSDIPREKLSAHLAEMEKSSTTLLELIGVVDNIKFEDQMRGNQ